VTRATVSRSADKHVSTSARQHVSTSARQHVSLIDPARIPPAEAGVGLPQGGVDAVWSVDGEADSTSSGYLPIARRWKRVRRSILRCFFFRMRLRRFLISDPMRWSPYPHHPGRCETGRAPTRGWFGGEDSNPYVEDQNLACCRLHHPRQTAHPNLPAYPRNVVGARGPRRARTVPWVHLRSRPSCWLPEKAPA
jgi:hypothetical protein